MKRRMPGNCLKILLFLVLSHWAEISTCNDAQKTQELRDEDLQVIDSLRKDEFENVDIGEIKKLLLTDVDDKPTKKNANGGHNFAYKTKKEPLNEVVHGSKNNTVNESKMVRINATAAKEKGGHVRNMSKAATAKVLDAIIHRMISERLHKAIVTNRTKEKPSSHLLGQTVAKQNNGTLLTPDPKIRTFSENFQNSLNSKTEHHASPLSKLGQRKDSIVFSSLEAIAHNILRVLKRREGLKGGARLRYKIKRSDLLRIRDFIKTTRDPRIERNVKVRSAKEALGSIKNLMKLIKKNNIEQTKSGRERGKLGTLKMKYAKPKSKVLPQDVKVNVNQQKSTAMNHESYINGPPGISERKANVSTIDKEKQKYYSKKLKALRLKLLKDKLLNVLKMKSNDTGLALNLKSLESKLHVLRRERRNSKKKLFMKRKEKKDKKKRFERKKSKSERNRELRKIVIDKINELKNAIKKHKDVETGSKRFLLLHGHKSFRKNLISLANLDASKMSGEDLEKLHDQLNEWIRDEEKLERKTEKGETKNEITPQVENDNDMLSSLERESNDGNNVIDNNSNDNIKNNNFNNKNNVENDNNENNYVLNSINNKNNEENNNNYISNNDHNNENNNNRVNINDNPPNEKEYSQNNIDDNNNQKNSYNSAINMNNVVDNNNSGKSPSDVYSNQDESAQYGSSVDSGNVKNNKNPNNYIYNNGNNEDSNNGLNSNNADANQGKNNNYEYGENDSSNGNNGDNGNNNSDNNKQQNIELDYNGKTNTNKGDNSNTENNPLNSNNIVEHNNGNEQKNIKFDINSSNNSDDDNNNINTENILPNSNNINNNNDNKQKSVELDYNGQTNPTNQGSSSNNDNDNNINNSNMYTEKNLLNSNNAINDNYDNHERNNNKFDSTEVNNVNNNYQSKIMNGNEKDYSNDYYKTNNENKNNNNDFMSNSKNHAEETIAANQANNKITNSDYSNANSNSFSDNKTSQSESSMNINNHDSKGGPSKTNKKGDGQIADEHKVNNPDYEDDYDYYDEDEEEEKLHPTKTSSPPSKQNTFQKPVDKKGTESQSLNSVKKHGSKDVSPINMVNAHNEELMGENHHVPSRTTNTDYVKESNSQSIPNSAGPSQEKVADQNPGYKMYINYKQTNHDPNVNAMEDKVHESFAHQGHKLRNHLEGYNNPNAVEYQDKFTVSTKSNPVATPGKNVQRIRSREKLFTSTRGRQPLHEHEASNNHNWEGATNSRVQNYPSYKNQRTDYMEGEENGLPGRLGDMREKGEKTNEEFTAMKDNQHFGNMYKYFPMAMKHRDYFSNRLNRHNKASSFNSQDAFNSNQFSGNFPYHKKVNQPFRPMPHNFHESERNRQHEMLESQEIDNRNRQEDNSQKMDDREETILSGMRNQERNEENTNESNMNEEENNTPGEKMNTAETNNGKVSEQEMTAQDERLTPTDMDRPVTGETRPNTAEMNTGNMNVNDKPSSENGPMSGSISESISVSGPQKTLGGKALLSDFLSEENKLKSGLTNNVPSVHKTNNEVKSPLNPKTNTENLPKAFPVTLEESNDELNQTSTTYDELNQTAKTKPDKNREFFYLPRLPKSGALIRGFVSNKPTDVIHVINPTPQPKAKVPKSEARIVSPPVSSKNKSTDYQPGLFMPTLKRVDTSVKVPNKKTKTTSLTEKTSGEPSPTGSTATSSDRPNFANEGSTAATEMGTSSPSSQIADQSLPGENRLTGNEKVANLNADEITSSVKDMGSFMDNEDKISLAQKASTGEVVPLSQGAEATTEPRITTGAGTIPPEHVLVSQGNIKGADTDLKPLVSDPEGKMSALQEIQAISKVQKEQESGEQEVEKISDPGFLEGMSNRIAMEGAPLADLSVTHSPSVPLRDINSPGSTLMVPFEKRDEKGSLVRNKTTILQRASSPLADSVVSKVGTVTSDTFSPHQPNLAAPLQQPATQPMSPDSQAHIIPPTGQPKTQSINHEPATSQVLQGPVSNSVAATQAPQAGPPERKFQNQAFTTSTLDNAKVPPQFQELLKAILTQQKPKQLAKQNAGIPSNIQQNTTSKMAEEIFDDPTKFGDSGVLLTSEKMETKPYYFSTPGPDKNIGAKLPKETPIDTKLKGPLENGGADKSKTSLFIPNVPVRPEGDEVYLGGGEAMLPNTPAATMSILSKSNLSNEEKVKLINAYQSSQKLTEPQQAPAQETPALEGGSQFSGGKGDKLQGNMFFKTGKPNGHELKGDVAGKEAAMQDLLMLQKERDIDDKLSQAHLMASQPNEIKGEGYAENSQQNIALPGNRLPGGEIQRQENWLTDVAMPENGSPGAGLQEQANGLPVVDPMENNVFKPNLNSAFSKVDPTTRKQKQMDKLLEDAQSGLSSSNLEQESMSGKMMGMQKPGRLKSTSDTFDSKVLNSGIDDERKAIENEMEPGKETMGDVDSSFNVGQFVDSVQGLSPAEVRAYGINVNNDVYIDKTQAQRLREKSSEVTYDAMMEETEETKNALKGVRKSNVNKEKSAIL